MLNRKVSLVKVWSGRSSHLTRLLGEAGGGLTWSWVGGADVAGTAVAGSFEGGEPGCGGLDALPSGVQAAARAMIAASANVLINSTECWHAGLV